MPGISVAKKSFPLAAILANIFLHNDRWEWLNLRYLKALTVFILVIIMGGCATDSSREGNWVVEVAGPGSHRTVKPALIRLEDVCPGGLYQGEETLKKMRVIAEYLHGEGVPFHISLIPRMVVPQKGYDVKITDQTPYAMEFLSTIKYMEGLGGIVGIHGYTHQTGNNVSGQGFEFYDRIKSPEPLDTYTYARERISSAMELFEKAGINPGYWETPHYTASMTQYPAFEEQTGLIYENHYRGVNAIKPRTYDYNGPGYRGFITVPTPLGYINPDVDAEKMIKTLDRLKGDLASFFYHPFREFNYISKAYRKNGEEYYVYDRGSPLHMLINSFKEKGYTFVSIYDLTKFIPAQRLENLSFAEGDNVMAGRFEPGSSQSVLVWNREVNQWRMYRYTASGYSPRKTGAFADGGVWISGWKLEKDAVPLVGDFNGNKMDDIMVFNPDGGTFTLAENKGGKLVPRDKVCLTLPRMKSIAPLAGDFNGDGLADVAVHDQEGKRIGLTINTTEGFSQIKWYQWEFLKGRNVKLLAGDFNGNKKTDIAVVDNDSGHLRVLLSGPGEGFTEAGDPWLKMWGSKDRWQPYSSDINGDGKSDLLFYSPKGQWQMATSDGQRFVYRGDFGPWGATRNGVTLAGDLNGDLRSDLVVIDRDRDQGYNLDTAISVLQK